MSQRQRAFVLYLTHNTFHQSGLTLTVTSYKSNLVAPLYRQVDAAEHTMVAVTLTHVLHRHRIVPATGRRRKLQPQSRRIFLVHLDNLQLFQHLHTALHLQRLTVCTLETFDIVFGFLNHLLLLLVLFHLLFAPFLTEFQILAVIDFVIVDTPHRDFYRTRRDIVHKLAVVADDHHGTGTLRQKMFQPLYALDVQMVGRLVQQQHVRILQQQFGQLDAHTPTSAEITRRPRKVRTLES